MLEIRKQISCPSYAARTQWNKGGGGDTGLAREYLSEEQEVWRQSVLQHRK